MSYISRISNASLLIFTLVCVSSAYGSEDLINEALSLSPDLQAGQKTYELCAACHGEDGFGLENGEYPSIAGQHPQVIIKQFIDIRAKKRINPTMFPFTELELIGGLQGLANIAAYSASLPRNPDPAQGMGNELELGESLFQKQCASCHGADAQGVSEHFYPRLSNQHYPYLLRELTWIRNGIRKNADPVMIETLKSYSDTDIMAVADYLSRNAFQAYP